MKIIEYDKKLDKVPKFAKAIASSVSKKLPVNNPKLRKARKFLEGVDLPMEERLIDYFYWLKNDDVVNIKHFFITAKFFNARDGVITRFFDSGIIIGPPQLRE